jgi:hypothetical protein
VKLANESKFFGEHDQKTKRKKEKRQVGEHSRFKVVKQLPKWRHLIITQS